MRLIDADEFLKEIVKRCGCIPCVESRNGETIYLNNLISEQPTAYVVDKVVERLEEMRSKREEQLRTCADNDMADYLRCRMSTIAEIIEIVKSGSTK